MLRALLTKTKDFFGPYYWPERDSDSTFSGARNRLVCGFSLVIGLNAILHNVHLWTLGDSLPDIVAFYSLVLAFAYFLVPSVLHRSRSTVATGLTLMVLLSTHTNLLMYFEETRVWLREAFLIGPPVIAILVVGARAAWITTALTCLNFFGLAYFDVLPPESATVMTIVICARVSGLALFETQLHRAEANLVELTQQAQDANLAKSEFLANMSHEIRTPMNALSGVLQLLDETKLTHEQRDLVRLGQASGSTLLRLINDVLDYSKIAARGVTFERSTCRPADLVLPATQAMQPLAEAQGLHLVYEQDDNLPDWILADPARMQQVVSNLISNAIKFSGKGTITVRTTRRGEALLIRVIDQGIGLTQAAQDRIFRKFEQAAASTTRQYGGTGLGLAISKELVELQGGEIGVKSSPGQGSTFWFTVPILPAEAPQEQVEAPETKTNAPQTDARGIEGARVLLVEDNRTNQVIATKFLQSMGIEPEIADNGLTAVALGTNRAFDLILMDIQLPGMDGIEACRAIKSSGEPNAETPIVALSANILPEQTASYIQAGMAACLGKPFRKDELADVMTRLIRQQPADPATTKKGPESEKPAA
ncbi:MAG: ATP-binding protein [Shimia sp.]|uniref:ATP-binding protein n=1 Tax=Shimia sp. TaxID=1954381 RepID=UPI004059C384